MVNWDVETLLGYEIGEGRENDNLRPKIRQISISQISNMLLSGESFSLLPFEVCDGLYFHPS